MKCSCSSYSSHSFIYPNDNNIYKLRSNWEDMQNNTIHLPITKSFRHSYKYVPKYMYEDTDEQSRRIQIAEVVTRNERAQGKRNEG